MLGGFSAHLFLVLFCFQILRILKGIKYFFPKALSKEIRKIKQPKHVSQLKDAPVTVLACFVTQERGLSEVLSGFKLQDLIDFCSNHLKIPLPIERSSPAILVALAD